MNCCAQDSGEDAKERKEEEEQHGVELADKDEAAVGAEG
jgi:hypothetical protein